MRLNLVDVWLRALRLGTPKKIPMRNLSFFSTNVQPQRKNSPLGTSLSATHGRRSTDTFSAKCSGFPEGELHRLDLTKKEGVLAN